MIGGRVAASTTHSPIDVADQGSRTTPGGDSLEDQCFVRTPSRVECRPVKKLVLDFATPLALPRRMDIDTRDLIRQLCTRAGMIMEDVVPLALLAPQEERLDDLAAATESIAAILLAARALRSHG